MRVAAAARPILARGTGTILNIASMLSFFGGALVPGYSASKGGISPAHQVACPCLCGGRVPRERARSGVDRHAAYPGAEGGPGAFRGHLRTALRRWGEPQDIAGAAVFLASLIGLLSSPAWALLGLIGRGISSPDRSPQARDAPRRRRRPLIGPLRVKRGGRTSPT